MTPGERSARAALTPAALEELRDLDFCYVTTKGRVSGRPHTIEIWFGVRDGRLYLLSGGGDRSDWVRNLRAHAAVSLEIGERSAAATARVVADSTEDAMARRLLAAKYQGWREGQPLSRWAATALPVVIEPDPGLG